MFGSRLLIHVYRYVELKIERGPFQFSLGAIPFNFLFPLGVGLGSTLRRSVWGNFAESEIFLFWNVSQILGRYSKFSRWLLFIHDTAETVFVRAVTSPPPGSYTYAHLWGHSKTPLNNKRVKVLTTLPGKLFLLYPIYPVSPFGNNLKVIATSSEITFRSPQKFIYF